MTVQASEGSGVVSRQEIARWIRPAFQGATVSRDYLLSHARLVGAPHAVCEALAELPADQGLRELRDIWIHLPEIPVTS